MDRERKAVDRTSYDVIPNADDEHQPAVSLRAAALMSLSAACFATNALCIKLLGKRFSHSSFELVFARGATALLLNTAILMRMQRPPATEEESMSGAEVAERRGGGASAARRAASALLLRERGGHGRLLLQRACFGFCGVACDYYGTGRGWITCLLTYCLTP
jgi:hypothetical protein